MKIRKEIRQLQPPDLLSLRRAMAEFQRRNGANSFIDIAGMHGVPRNLCPHGSVIFLPWHRVYITQFEEGLRAIDSTVTLPYWDWTSSDSLASGMARAHRDETYQEPDNTTKPNPLFSGPIEDRSRQTVRRGTNNLQRLSSIASTARLAMRERTYAAFNQEIEGPHGDVHVWVGGSFPRGDMSSTARASYDPIFWSHHANVDRQWAIWQKCNPNALPPQEIRNRALPGFPGWTVADTLDHTSARLDFSYEGLAGEPCPVPVVPVPDMTGVLALPEGATLARTPSVIVEVHDVDRSGESFMVDIFVSAADEPPDAARGSESFFAGSFGIFGAEGAHGGGHGDGHGVHQLKGTRRVDITEAVDRLDLRGRELRVQLMATTAEGEEVPAERLPIGGITVSVI